MGRPLRFAALLTAFALATLALPTPALAQSRIANDWQPASGRDNVAQNVIPRSIYIGKVPAAPGDIKLVREDGAVVPSEVTLDALGEKVMHCAMKPMSLVLPPGKYKVVTAAKPEGATTFTVTLGSDSSPPAGITKADVTKSDFTGGAFQISATFQPPADDRTPTDALAYNVYLARDPTLPDSTGAPSFVATRVDKLPDGRVSLVVADGDIVLGQKTQLGGGKWRMQIRAVDEAGNLGPPSDSLLLTLPAEGSSVPEGGCACTSARAPAPGATAGGALLAGLAFAAKRVARRRARRG